MSKSIQLWIEDKKKEGEALVYIGEPVCYNSEYGIIHMIEKSAYDKALTSLKLIHSTKGMTLLSDCCVNKTCIPAYDHEGKKIGNCQHQWGVARGYGENAFKAEETLKELGELD